MSGARLVAMAVLAEIEHAGDLEASLEAFRALGVRVSVKQTRESSVVVELVAPASVTWPADVYWPEIQAQAEEAGACIDMLVAAA